MSPPVLSVEAKILLQKSKRHKRANSVLPGSGFIQIVCGPNVDFSAYC